MVDFLLALGYRVRVFDNLSTGYLLYLPLDNERLEFMYGDITNLEDLKIAIEGWNATFRTLWFSSILYLQEYTSCFSISHNLIFKSVGV